MPIFIPTQKDHQYNIINFLVLVHTFVKCKKNKRTTDKKHHNNIAPFDSHFCKKKKNI